MERKMIGLLVAALLGGLIGGSTVFAISTHSPNSTNASCAGTYDGTPPVAKPLQLLKTTIVNSTTVVFSLCSTSQVQIVSAGASERASNGTTIWCTCGYEDLRGTGPTFSSGQTQNFSYTPSAHIQVPDFQHGNLYRFALIDTNNYDYVVDINY